MSELGRGDEPLLQSQGSIEVAHGRGACEPPVAHPPAQRSRGGHEQDPGDPDDPSGMKPDGLEPPRDKARDPHAQTSQDPEVGDEGGAVARGDLLEDLGEVRHGSYGMARVSKCPAVSRPACRVSSTHTRVGAPVGAELASDPAVGPAES